MSGPDPLRLGFKALTRTRLLCHAIAEHGELYAAQGVAVQLRDITFTPDERLDHATAQASCASALLSIQRGMPLEVAFAAAERPMFWLYARRGTALSDLADGRIARYPEAAPPALFLRLALAQQGLEQDEVEVIAARDDLARLGLLVTGQVRAAVLSSATPAPRLERLGMKALVLFCWATSSRCPARASRCSPTWRLMSGSAPMP